MDVLAYLKERAARVDRFLDAAYPPFWRRELDIEDLTVLEATLAGCGCETGGFRAFAAGPGRRRVNDLGQEPISGGVRAGLEKSPEVAVIRKGGRKTLQARPVGSIPG